MIVKEEEEVIFWYLMRYGKERGYTLPESEKAEFVRHSDQQMMILFEKWRKGLKRAVDKKGYRIT